MNDNNLKQFFPIIRTKNEILTEIGKNTALSEIYCSWREDEQQQFIDMCTGAKGVKMLYDAYFKEIFNPEFAPERLSSMLSTLMDRKVTVKAVLPNDSTRLGDELSLVITDIVVELEDGTLANVEVQKLGYAFTGERASCYSADLLLRQYKRLRDSRKQEFSYRDIAPVYTIVFMETSPEIFHAYKDTYVHKFRSISDTGLKLNMLQNFIFVPVDIFIENLHNNGIRTELDAWLTFLGCDEPEYIMNLIQKYPSFKPLYDDVYEMCRNLEGVMNMFSKELQILDRNTVKYMFEEYKEKLEASQKQLETSKKQLDAANATIAKDKETLANQNIEIAELRARLAKYENQQ